MLLNFPMISEGLARAHPVKTARKTSGRQDSFQRSSSFGGDASTPFEAWAGSSRNGGLVAAYVHPIENINACLVLEKMDGFPLVGWGLGLMESYY